MGGSRRGTHTLASSVTPRFCGANDQVNVFRQLLISLVVLVIVGLGYLYLVPGAPDTLKTMGVVLPFGPQPTAAQKAAAGAGHGGYSRILTVATSPVTTAKIDDKLNAIGSGVAIHSVAVTTQATGTLTDWLVRPGDHVVAGQTLGQLDADTQEIALEKAKLAAKDADAALQRTKTLAKTNSATQVQLSTAQLTADNANLAVKSAQLDLTKRSIVTPIAGVVGLLKVTPGNAVNADTVVTTVDDASSILVNYWVPERYASEIRTGMAVKAQTVALPGQTFPGTVSAIDTQVDTTSRTLQVQAIVPNPKGQIRDGMSFSVTMSFPGKSFPSVDPLAVQWSADGSYVWQYAGGKVHKVMAAIIERNNDGVLLKGPLKPGEMVVTQGVEELADGDNVRDLNSTPATSAPPTKTSQNGASNDLTSKSTARS